MTNTKQHGNKDRHYNTANPTGIRKADFATYDEYLAAYQAAYRRMKYIEKHGIAPEEVDRHCQVHPDIELERQENGKWKCSECIAIKEANRERWKSRVENAPDRRKAKQEERTRKASERAAKKEERLRLESLEAQQKEAERLKIASRVRTLTEGFSLTNEEEQRFYSKIKNEGDCRVWTGPDEFPVAATRFRPHRLLWFVENGEIPNGFVLHKNCETKGCISPQCRTAGPPVEAKAKIEYIPSYRDIPDLTPAEIDRFHETVNRDGDCWVWLGNSEEEGYGRFYSKGVHYAAHRIAYKLAFGTINNTLQVMHACDSSFCVNPAHLSQGTIADNFADSVEKGRVWTEAFQKHLVIPDDEQVAEIARLLALNVKPVSLRRKYGVSLDIIQKIGEGSYQKE